MSRVRVNKFIVLIDYIYIVFYNFYKACDHLNTFLGLSHDLGGALNHKRPLFIWAVCT